MIGDAVLRPDRAILDLKGTQVLVRDKLEIGHHADAESALDRFPDALAALDLEHGLIGKPSCLHRRFECPPCGRAALAQDKGWLGELAQPDRFPVEPG